MTGFDDIRQKIMADPANAEYTARSIGPLFKASSEARIVIVGQAPGRKAEESGLFWNDPSGDRLRDWMGITRSEFYASDRIAQLPMDFYFPGKGRSGDLPPRAGFAEKWHLCLLDRMPRVDTIVLIGSYAQRYYLGNQREANLTETVRNFRKYLPVYFPLVHPSPINVGWFKKNPWFEQDVLPVFKAIIAHALIT